MVKIIMLIMAWLVIMAGCGTDTHTVQEITPPQPQEYETIVRCWTELRCYRSKKTCRRKCREVEFCEETIVPVGI